MKTSLIITCVSAFLIGAGLSVQAASPSAGAAGRRGGARRGGATSQRGPASTQHEAAASQRAATEAAEVAALRPAFDLLLNADHDYQGHRAKAMVAIAEACKLMGTDIVPPGLREKLENAGSTTKPATAPSTTKPAGRGEHHATTEPESQSASDDQLHQALGIVQQVRTSIGSGKQPRIAELLDKAIADITAALGVK